MFITKFFTEKHLHVENTQKMVEKILKFIINGKRRFTDLKHLWIHWFISLFDLDLTLYYCFYVLSDSQTIA